MLRALRSLEFSHPELLVIGLAVLCVAVPMYIAGLFAKKSGRSTLLWVLLALPIGPLIVPVILVTMLFGKEPFADGVPRRGPRPPRPTGR